ncbi:zinc finger protein 37-like [Mercenaria mercenaria]|uniref:zinc finger protein 37-like n=1 Tax=Mercenaria mercenaria TaxID=6596 RepID=UPI00234E9E37|nr:zinc finger protein 37-like [Mercenaria mercenaria]XP_053374633.1 zinc finger protein 37-like [Mercenaria mercenaria]
MLCYEYLKALKKLKEMDIKKEIEEESEMMDELVNDIKQLSENGNAEIEDEPAYSVSETVENSIVKTELDSDIGFCDADVGYSFENYDISLAVKPEEENNSDENTGLEIERNSLKDEDLEAKGNDFVKMEAELYQQSDDSLDIVGNDNSFFTLDYTEKTEREFSRKSGSGACRSGTRINEDGSCNDDESDTELDYGNETDSYNEEDYECKLDIVIKKEKAEFIEQEINEGSVEEGKDQVIDYGRKTKKAKNYVCDLCSKAFTSDNRLKRHKEHLHPDGGNDDRPFKEGKYICEVCNKRFISQSRLRLHTVTHTGEKPFSCDICGQKFSHPTNKRRHMKTHTGDKPFVCLFCGKSFPVKHYLKDHLVKHTGEKPHECKLCSMTFAHRFSLKQHELLKHPGGELNFNDTYDDRPFSCEMCGKKFTQQSSLKIHVRLHTGSKPYKCSECDASFVRSDSLLRHKFEHSGQRPFQCDMCEKAFTSAYILKQHRNVHTGDRRQQCEHCGVELANKESLTRHMMRHTGESLLECETCHKKFVHEQSLKRHQEHPCDEKIYECRVCDYKNSSESKLKRHLLKHNAQKLLECMICKNKFTYPSNLKRHMKVHEKDHEMKTRRKETIISNDDVEQFIAVSMTENEKMEDIIVINRKTRKTHIKPKASQEKTISVLNQIDEQDDKLQKLKEKVNSVNSDADEPLLAYPDFASEAERHKQINGSTADDLRNSLKKDRKMKTYFTSQYEGNITRLKEQYDATQKPVLDDISHKQHDGHNERNKEYKATLGYNVEHNPIIVGSEYSPPFENESRKNAAKTQSQCEGYIDMFIEQKVDDADRAGINQTSTCDLELRQNIPDSETSLCKSFDSVDSDSQTLFKRTHLGTSDTSDCNSVSLQAQDKRKEKDTAHIYTHSLDTGHFSNYVPFDFKVPQSKDLYSTVTQSAYSAVPYNTALFAGRLPAFSGSFCTPDNLNISRNATLSNETIFGGEISQIEPEDYANMNTRSKILVQDILKKMYRQKEEFDSNSTGS